MVKNLKINLQLFSEEDPKPTFTQEDMNAAITKRLDRERKTLQADYETKLAAAKAEAGKNTNDKGDNKTPKFEMPKEFIDRLDKLSADNSSLKSSLNEKAQLDAVKGANIKPEMQEFVKFQVAQGVTEGTTFNDALKTYLEANKHVLNAKGHPLGQRGEGSTRTKENFDNIEAILKNKYPGKYGV